MNQISVVVIFSLLTTIISILITFIVAQASNRLKSLIDKIDTLFKRLAESNTEIAKHKIEIDFLKKDHERINGLLIDIFDQLRKFHKHIHKED